MTNLTALAFLLSLPLPSKVHLETATITKCLLLTQSPSPAAPAKKPGKTIAAIVEPTQKSSPAGTKPTSSPSPVTANTLPATAVPVGTVAASPSIAPTVIAPPIISPAAPALSPPSIAASDGIAPGPKNVTNVFTDTDIKQVLGDLGTQSGFSIVADETVTGNISATFKDTPLEKALAVVLAPGNYAYVKMEDFYLVGKADPTSPNYLRFATTVVYKPDYSTAERLMSVLPTAETPYVKSAPGELGLTITAAPALRDRILADLHLLDRAPKRIMMEALVTEMSTEVMNQYSFSWLWRQFGLTGDTAGTALSYTKVVQSDVETLKGLIGLGKAEVRANPRIMAIEGKESSVEVAQENYFQVLTGQANFAYTSLQTIKTGISLKMTPTLSSNGEITVQIAPEVSDAQGNSSNGLPSNTVRRATTTVRVKDGETIVIGGMTYVNNRKTTNKVPVLGDLPGVGPLFRSHNIDNKKTDVIIMITPHIVKD